MLKVELGGRVGKEEPPNVHVWTEQKLRIVLKIQFMCLKLKHSSVPFWRELFFSLTSMSLFVLHGHHLILEVTQALPKALLLQAAALYHLKLEERQFQARAWSSPNCSEGKFSSTWKRRVGFIYLHFPLKSKPFSTAVRWNRSSPGLAQWAVFILPMLGLWHSHCRASTLVLLLSDPFPC